MALEADYRDGLRYVFDRGMLAQFTHVGTLGRITQPRASRDIAIHLQTNLSTRVRFSKELLS